MKKLILNSVLAILFVAFVMAGAASASPAFNDVIVEYWTGTGPDQALLIIDFDETSTSDSFAFGYNFDASQSKTGEDMIKDIAANGMLDIFSSGTGPFSDPSGGFFLQDIAYLGNERGFNNTPSEFWSYWVEGGDPFDSWTNSAIGAGERVLSDLSWDGWSIPFGGAPNFDPPPAPDVPAVPIPGAAWLLGSGLVALVGLGRRAKRQ